MARWFIGAVIKKLSERLGGIEMAYYPDDDKLSVGEALTKGAAIIMMLGTACVACSAFSAVLLGLFIRITYWVINFRF